MIIQIAFISLCVAAAFIFMARRCYRTIKKRGGCACDASTQCKGVNMPCRTNSCPGGKKLDELRPR